MKKHVVEFIRRGMMAAWCGPVIMAIVYAILNANGVAQVMTVNEVCRGVISSTLMAFIAAGIPVVYQVEQLPLPMAILIHGGVLYLDYLLVYLMNGWLKSQLGPIAVFTVIFVAGFALIWLIIYLTTKKQISQLNRKMQAQ